MRAPKRKRHLVRKLLIREQIRNLDKELKFASENATYIGSPEHKKSPSFAGQPKPRADASICPEKLTGKLKQVITMLKQGLRKGAVSEFWEGTFPRYVWYKDDGMVYEGRLVNKENGEYKGYPFNRSEWPKGIEKFYE